MKNMRELLILFFILIFGTNTALAYDLVLPKEKKSAVYTNYAFFVGKASPSETITINDEKVYTASNGAFAHTVKLKNGENRILIKSNYNTQVYKVTKLFPEKASDLTLFEFEPKLYKVKKDNTPLRSTPIDFGMNRLSHLFKDTNLIINGEKGDFYRVFLSKDTIAWVAKESVEEFKKEFEAPTFITMNSKTFSNASSHVIEFTDKLPYTIEEINNEVLFKIYNPFYSEDSVYTITVKKPEKYFYSTKLHKGTYLFKLNHLPLTEKCNLEGYTITVDAGHGGSEKGALGCLGDNEKDINLKIAQELKEILGLMGANVIMTRECDANVSLDDRINLAKENCSEIFISIHLNSIPDIPMNIHKNRGTSVYYYNKNSKALAQILEQNLTKTLGTRKDGVREGSFAVIRPTDYVGILIETAYMTNPNDTLIYTDENFAEKTAKSIAESVLEFVTLK